MNKYRLLFDCLSFPYSFKYYFFFIIILTIHIYSQNYIHSNTNRELNNLSVPLGFSLGYSNVLVNDGLSLITLSYQESVFYLRNKNKVKLTDVYESRHIGLPLHDLFNYKKLRNKIAVYRTLSGFSMSFSTFIFIAYGTGGEAMSLLSLVVPLAIFASLANLENTVKYNVAFSNNQLLNGYRKKAYTPRIIITQSIASLLWGTCLPLFISTLSSNGKYRNNIGVRAVIGIGIFTGINLNLLGIRYSKTKRKTYKPNNTSIFLGGSKNGMIAGLRMSF